MTTFEKDVQARLFAVRNKLARSAEEPRLTEGGQRELAEIDAALLKLEEGRFGLCEGCGGALGRQRLLADPTAVLCLSCLQKSE